MIKLNLYIKEIFDFLSTCSIKNVFLEQSIRRVYEETHGLSTTPVWDNPYYQHLCGHYNRYDNKIYVKSLDDGSMVLFNRYVLKSHIKTFNKYQSRQDEFKSLMMEYPDMTDYIRGTIYPAETISDGVLTPNVLPQVTNEDGSIVMDLTQYNMALNPDILKRYQTGYVDNANYKDLILGESDAVIDYVDSILWPIREDDHLITSPNLTLLNMNKNLLHPNEQVDLITHMKQWLTMFDVRWAVGEFRYEEYYDGVRDSLMWQCLATELLSRRSVNIRTNNVHAYHIWEYLESHGLGDYRSILSPKQELFLYKNMNYLTGNRGKMSNLKILSENLLEGYGAEIKSKAILQDTAGATDECSTTPLVISESLDTDITALQNSEDGTESIKEIVRREYRNKLEPEFNEGVVADQTNILKNSEKTYLQTKLVEVVKHTEGDMFKNLYLNFIAQSTIYKLAMGRCNYPINLRITEIESTISFTLGECIALLLYASHLEVMHTLDRSSGELEIKNQPLENLPTQWYVYLPYKEVKSPLPEYVYSGTVRTFRPIKINTRSMLLTPKVGIHPDPREPMDMSNMRLAIYDDPVPDLDTDIEDSLQLVGVLDGVKNQQGQPDRPGQWDMLKSQYIQSRGCSDIVQGRAYRVAWEALRFEGLLTFDLIPGYTTYTDWIHADAILRPMFAAWELRSDANTLYAGLCSDIIKAIYPGNTMLSEFTNEEYKLMVKLLEQLSSYNIAFIDRDAVGGESHDLMHISQIWHDEYNNVHGYVDVCKFEEACSQEIDESGEMENVNIDIITESESHDYGNVEGIEGTASAVSDDYWERNWVPDLEVTEEP